MPDDVVQVLKAARQRQREERLRFGEGYGSGAYVCSREDGHPLHPDALTSRWQKMLKTMGISYVRLHDARHSCGTLMHHQGVPDKDLAAWLGHASASFTIATYVHSQAEHLRAAASSYGRLGTLWEIETPSGGDR